MSGPKGKNVGKCHASAEICENKELLNLTIQTMLLLMVCALKQFRPEGNSPREYYSAQEALLVGLGIGDLIDHKSDATLGDDV